MDEEYQRMASHAIAHEAWCAGQAWQQAAAAHERPCVLWKPRLFIDGNQWCALFGENIQEGVVGFGSSPDAAMQAFDVAWREDLPDHLKSQPAPSVPAGWKRVPIEPTKEMLESTWVDSAVMEADGHNGIRAALYRAMLAAAPKSEGEVDKC